MMIIVIAPDNIIVIIVANRSHSSNYFNNDIRSTSNSNSIITVIVLVIVGQPFTRSANKYCLYSYIIHTLLRHKVYCLCILHNSLQLILTSCNLTVILILYDYRLGSPSPRPRGNHLSSTTCLTTSKLTMRGHLKIPIKDIRSKERDPNPKDNSLIRKDSCA